MEKLLPLLSGKLKSELIALIAAHPDCKIAQELIIASDAIDNINVETDLASYTSDNFSINMLEIRVAEWNNTINSYLTNFGRMISFRQDEFSLSFLPEGKIPEYNAAREWSRTNRQEMKPARLIQKVLAKKHTCKEFEDFSNYLKVQILDCGEFILVSGEDIPKYYNSDNYIKQESTLGHSCMKGSGCETFFDIYVDHAKMLVYINPVLDKIYARALVWEIEDKVYLDRIYYCYDYLKNYYIGYAKERGWYIRNNNSLLETGNTQGWRGPKDDYSTVHFPKLTIQLNKIYDNWPYLDSFRYLDLDKQILTTYLSSNNENLKVLDCTEGWYNSLGEVYECAFCHSIAVSYDSDEYPDDWQYSEYDDCYYCPQCAIYCDGIDDYVGPNSTIVSVHAPDAMQLNFPLSYVIDSDSFCEICGEWYTIDHPNVTLDENNEYVVLKEE